MEKALSVTKLNEYIKFMLDNDEVLQSICVIGEISNFKKTLNGHIYLSLKDEKSSISAVIFAKYVNKNLAEMEDGVKVLVYGYISSYITAGKYQLYVCKILPHGEGEINKALKKLKEKLTKEGIFDPNLKKDIIKFPKKIGVITSATGAVFHDIKSVLKRRYPLGKILLYHVKVQGVNACKNIVEALHCLNNMKDIDCIIIGRGGGSVEELWAFNEECVVRSIACSVKPIISAVGHDTDYTLCDLAADLRAPTPSAAAELASVNIFEQLNFARNLCNKVEILIKNKVVMQKKNLELIKNKINNLKDIRISNMKSELSQIKSSLKNLIKNIIEKRKQTVKDLKSKIIFLNPHNILKKGYVLILDDNNKIMSDENSIKEKKKIKILTKNRVMIMEVRNIKNKNNNHYI
ncbi:MAG: exodeoxyribonuclease VII large subunit [Candidatus Improbicoccus pseudotrichonymphae]|uniref:Exodeoxyribonuclease 7 large subunit n=1 Tax=Candidatus Improbicoccus pseudotrichonymphae TaxID=3033792 RepID=A0AA48L0U8_9FIRM|nr:MAG: exodeoxyribonuclease VII large subunit [Candidatus Improbicoccus pseudotrichonymphae]